MTVNKLSLNSEITVLRACGIGISRIAKTNFWVCNFNDNCKFSNKRIYCPRNKYAGKTFGGLFTSKQTYVPDGRMNFTLNENDKRRKIKKTFYVQNVKIKH